MNVRNRIGALVVVTGITAGGIGLSAGAAHGARGRVPRTDECVAHLTSAHDQGISLTTSPVAGGTVAPGSTVTVTTRWDADAWEELNRILLCVTSDGAFTTTLSGGEKPADNDGEKVWTMTVPAAAADGTELCIRSVIFGNAIGAPDVQKSATSCLRVASAVATTTTTTVPASLDEPDPKVEIAAPEGSSVEPAVLSTPGQLVDAQPEALPELPRTGSATETLAIAGGGAIVVGGLALIAGRRKRSTTAA